jgi:hypothetical protein
MDSPHTTNGYTNPEVRFERTDVDDRALAKLAIGLVVLIAVSTAIVTGLFVAINRHEDRRKETTLPPAAVDALPSDRLPPQPRLEALDDIRERNVRLQPPRARDFLGAQEALLAKGDKKKGILPIEEAIDALAGKLPHRKDVPASSSPQPGKASSGRFVTEGQ